MTYYKIVRKIGRKLKSCMVPSWSIDNDLMNLLCVEYKLGEYVYPKLEGSKLYVFFNVDDAINFIFNSCWFEIKKYSIYECEVENPGKISPIDSIHNIKDYWKKKRLHQKTSNFSLMKNPKFVSCDSVKLTKKVKW